jgi:hypothetical protein
MTSTVTMPGMLQDKRSYLHPWRRTWPPLGQSYKAQNILLEDAKKVLGKKEKGPIKSRQSRHLGPMLVT